MKKAVVTGGAGFIGSALVRVLLEHGASEVDVIDNLLTGHEHNLEEVSGGVRLHKLDIRDAAAIGSMSASMRAAVSSIAFAICARSSASSVAISKLSSSFVLNAAIASVRPSITANRVSGVESCKTGSYGNPAIA